MKNVTPLNGLTLIEVLIALLVIALVFTALVGSQVTSLRMTRTARESSLATQLAVDTLTDRTVAVTADYDAYEPCSAPDVGGCFGTVSRDNYDAHWTVVRGTGYEFDGLWRIDVQVTGPATAQMATYISCMDYDAEVETPTLLNPGICEPMEP